MVTYINIRNVLSISQDEHEHKNIKTNKKGIVKTLNITTKDGETIINIFEDV